MTNPSGTYFPLAPLNPVVIQSFHMGLERAMDEEPKCVVYQATNKTNGKRYIGMTSRGLAMRKGGHKWEAANGVARPFSRAIKKYGFNAFDFTIIEVCADYEHSLERERALIAELKPEYNLAAGGLRGGQGWKHKPESIEKMRAARALQPSYWKGKKRSPESIAKRTATRALNPVRTWLGKKRPEMAAIIREKWPRLPNDNPTPGMLRARRENMTTANARRMKPVLCLSDGEMHASIRHAARHYNMAKSMIARACKGERPAARGLRFCFLEVDT